MRSNNSNPSWRGDDAGRPRFGARGRAWLQAKLEAELPTRYTLSPESHALVPRVAAFYVACWRDVVCWVPAATYLGPGYAAGAWQVDWPIVLDKLLAGEVWRAAERAARAERDTAALAADAARYPTLDAWLEAERRGRLAHRGTYEKHAEWFVPQDRGIELITNAERRRARWPRDCRACGREFRPERKSHVRCNACRAAPKTPPPAARAAGAGERATRRSTCSPAAPALVPAYTPGRYELDPAAAPVSSLVGFWTGVTEGALSAYCRDDDPTSPVNRLAALVAHLDRIGRADAAAALRPVLAEARATTARHRERLAHPGIAPP